MAAANYLSSEDQFLCSICLDVFTDPVTTSCGHNFCKNCITEHWNNNDQYLCPMCQEGFTIRPDLKINTFISEMMLSKDVKKLLQSELKRVQQYAVDVTLDPDTAHPNLILSHDRKQVRPGKVKRNLLDNPGRFSECVCRFYFEVQVKRKTEWTLGVARESINREGQITASPQNGVWIKFLGLRRWGVFVDYEEGLVSFYDVDTAALIYSFTGCSFTEKLFPYFSHCGGKKSTALIISPVRIN
uniref:Uncharacterized protein n=1 Tax=Sander lucioperca TaxID=283035 RepID=A0A8C9XUI1_SANLU